MYTLIETKRGRNPQPSLNEDGNPTGDFSEYVNVTVNDGENDIVLTVKNIQGISIPFIFSITDSPEQIQAKAEAIAQNYVNQLNNQ